MNQFKLAKLPFRYKLLLCCLSILLLALLMFFLFSNYLFASNFLSETQKNAINELTLIDQNINHLTNTLGSYVRLISVDSELQSLLNEYKHTSNVTQKSYVRHSFYARMPEVFSGFYLSSANVVSSIIWVDSEVVYSATSFDERLLDNPLFQEHLSSTMQSTAPQWLSTPISLELSTSTNLSAQHNVFALSKQVIDRSTGQSLGVLTLLLDESSFSNIYSEGVQGRYYLMDQNNTIVSCSDKSVLYESAQSVFNLSVSELSQLQSDSNVVLQKDSKEYLLTLIHSHPLNWGLLCYTDLQALSSQHDQITMILVVVFLVTALLSFVALWFTSNAITQPITLLVDLVEHYDDNHTNLRAPDNIYGEVGVLANGFNKLLDKVAQNIQEIEQNQQSQRQYELKILQEQINPHFLYNTLQTIASLILLKQYDQGLDSIYALSDFYKYCLSYGQNLITVEEELVIVEKYLKIQHIRYGDYFDYYIDVEDSVRSVQIPKLTLQPLIENAIYHGLKPKGCLGTLMVSGYETPNGITLEVTDSGVGMSEDTIKYLLQSNTSDTMATSVGVRNVIGRLSLLYGSRFNVDIRSKPNEYSTIVLEIDLDNYGGQ